MVAGPSSSVLPDLRKDFLSHFYHIIDSKSDYDDDDGDNRFDDASTHGGIYVKPGLVLKRLIRIAI